MAGLPVLWSPISRYTSNTNVLVPLLVSFIRAGAILMLDWVTMRFVDNAPTQVWILTGAFALGILVVLQTKDWLDFKGKWYFTSFISAVLIGWAASVGYAYWAYYSPPEKPPAFPTADEIGAAIARYLPKASLPSVVSAAGGQNPPSPPVYVNPLHEEATKWKFAEGIRSAILRSGLTADCHVTIVEVPAAFAQDYAEDFKRVLDVIGWTHDEIIATRPVEKGLSVRAEQRVPTQDCAQALQSRVQNNGLSRSGGTLNTGLQWITKSELPPYLASCGSAACVEVNIGLDDGH